MKRITDRLLIGSKNATLLLFAGALLCGCTESRKDWTREDVVGLRIELIDSVNIEQMSFSKDGLVPYTIGKKGGGITAPLYYWRLTNGCLQIFDTENIIQQEFTLISKDSSTIKVRNREGKTARYRIREKRAD